MRFLSAYYFFLSNRTRFFSQSDTKQKAGVDLVPLSRPSLIGIIQLTGGVKGGASIYKLGFLNLHPFFRPTLDWFPFGVRHRNTSYKMQQLAGDVFVSLIFSETNKQFSTVAFNY